VLNTDRASAPLYLQLKAEIKKKIDEGIWKPGDKIPPEVELCRTYNVSRITVREAINELVWEEYLVRHRAKGTFVLDIAKKKSDNDYYTYVKSFTYEMSEMGKQAKTVHAEAAKMHADSFIADQLKMEEGEPVLVLKRVRGIDNELLVFSVSYLRFYPFFSLDSADYYGSLYEMLKKNGVRLTKIKEYLEAVKPSAEVRERLNISDDVPVLKRVRHALNQHGNMVEFTESYYAGERYRYYVELTHSV